MAFMSNDTHLHVGYIYTMQSVSGLDSFEGRGTGIYLIFFFIRRIFLACTRCSTSYQFFLLHRFHAFSHILLLYLSHGEVRNA